MIHIGNDKIRSNNVNLDANYGPYESPSAAHAALADNEKNKIGVTVGVIENNTITEYWYQGGTTEQHLVKKQSAEVTVDNELSGTSENPVQNKVIKNALDLKAPSTGISKSALAESVQNSLGKADTALQSFTETDPTVPSWAKTATKPTYTATEIGAIPVPSNNPSSDKVLGYNNGAVSWVTKPSDGLSAYELYVEEYKTAHSGDATGAMIEAEWLTSLKAQFGSFVPADYGTDGVPASGGSDITASADTTNHIYLVNNDSTTPTGKTMWITVVDDSDPNNITYDWTSIGDVQVDITFGSGQTLNDVKIKDENGDDDPDAQAVLSAEVGTMLNRYKTDAVLKPGKNLFNKNKPVEDGYYINTNNEYGYSYNANNIGKYSVSYPIPVTAGKKYHIHRDENMALFYARFMSSQNIDTVGTDCVGSSISIKNTDTPELNGYGKTVEAPEGANYIRLQVEWNNVDGANELQIEEGEEFTGYESYTEQKELIESQIPSKLNIEIEGINNNITDINSKLDGQKTNKLVFDKGEGQTSYILSPFNDSYDIKLEFISSRNLSFLTNNPSFNFQYVKLVNKETDSETTVHDCKDDICPTDFGGQYIGGNHGALGVSVVTHTGHGKSVADIGSKWATGDNSIFTIVGIGDANTIYFVGQNTKTYPQYSFSRVSCGATLTHVSGATNTNDVIDENTGSGNVPTKQWWSAYEKPELIISADDKQITDSGTYNFSKLVISEIYDVINPVSALEYIQNHAGTFLSNVSPADVANQQGVDKYSRHTINYIFKSASQCVVTTDILFYQGVGNGYYGFIQQAILSGSDIDVYIPKAKSIEGGTVQSDPRNIISIDTLKGNTIAPNDYEDVNLPPDRWLQISENIGFTAGYLFDYGVGGDNRKNAIIDGSAIGISNTGKMYPRGVAKEITAFDHYSAACFRNYLDINTINNDNIIAANCFDFNNRYYLYLDFSHPGIYEIDIPEQYVGKFVNVFEKRLNVELLTQISASKILVRVTEPSLPNENQYGYLVGYIEA